MERTGILATLTALSAVAFCAPDASASYHPGLGRWVQRDPVGTTNEAPADTFAEPGMATRPYSGGFVQRDPPPQAQYSDGMHLYQYGMSQPPHRTDPRGTLLPPILVAPNLLPPVPPPGPSGPSAHDVAIRALTAIDQEHAGHPYYEADNGWVTGFRHLLQDTVLPALRYYDDARFGPSGDAVAQWYNIRNVLYVKRNPQPYAVLHESIHMYCDWVDQNEDARTTEGLAHAVAVEDVARMAPAFRKLWPMEKALTARGSDNMRIKMLTKAWRDTWLGMNVVGNPGEYNKKPFTVTVADVKLVNSFLGLKARCSDIAAVYNKQPGAKALCVEFMCSPNAVSTKGGTWIAVSPQKELDEPFK